MNIVDYDNMTVQIQSQYELNFLIEAVLFHSNRKNQSAAMALLRQLCKLQKPDPPPQEWLELLQELD